MIRAPLAQLAERLAFNQVVKGSSPLRGTSGKECLAFSIALQYDAVAYTDASELVHSPCYSGAVCSAQRNRITHSHISDMKTRKSNSWVACSHGLKKNGCFTITR